MSDEFYYLDSTERLAWGYVDHPPLSLAVLKLVRATFGDSLFAVRLLPSVLAAALVWVAAALAREFGGDRSAQCLAGLATATTPVFLGVTSFYSMNAIELFVWAVASLCVARIVNSGDSRLWIALGVLMGLGLLNKISMSWFGFGLGVGLIFTDQRRWLATPWPWAAAGIAFAIFAPHVFWQIEHDWPTLEFMRNAATEKMVAKSPVQFLLDQLLVMNPLFAPLWMAGLVHFFRRDEGRRHQIQAWIWLSVCGLLIANGAGRANYLAPAYVALFAAGGVAFERFAQSPPRALAACRDCGCPRRRWHGDRTDRAALTIARAIRDLFESTWHYPSRRGTDGLRGDAAPLRSALWLARADRRHRTRAEYSHLRGTKKRSGARRLVRGYGCGQFPRPRTGTPAGDLRA